MTELFATMPPWVTALLATTGVCIIISFWAIWHAYQRDFATSQEKVLWMSVAVFVPFLGGIAYLVLGRKRGRLSL